MKTKKGFIIAIVIAAVLFSVLTIPYIVLDSGKIALDDVSRSGIEGSFLKLPDGVVHYESKGSGKAGTVVLVHGFSVPYYIWDPVFNALTDSGFHVIRYDLYGRGYSDRPDTAYDLDLFVLQLKSLLDALRTNEQVDLIGLSFGGPVVARFFNKYPGKVRKLCFIDPLVSKVEPGRIFPLNVPLVGEYFMTVMMVPFFLPRSQSDDLYRPERFPQWEILYREQTKYKGFGKAILSTIRHMSEIDALAEYTTIGLTRCPVLLIWGKEDKTISYPEIEKARKAMPGARFYPVAEAGHIPMYERPEIVNPVIIEFLGSSNKGSK